MLIEILIAQTNHLVHVNARFYTRAMCIRNINGTILVAMLLVNPTYSLKQRDDLGKRLTDLLHFVIRSLKLI